MFIGHFPLIVIMFWTLIFDVHTDQSKLLAVSVRTISLSIECREECSSDYCLEYISLNKNCTKLIRDQCDCCTVCLRNENDICGGRFQIYGICEQDFFCYQANQTEKKGICVKG